MQHYGSRPAFGADPGFWERRGVLGEGTEGGGPPMTARGSAWGEALQPIFCFCVCLARNSHSDIHAIHIYTCTSRDIRIYY